MFRQKAVHGGAAVYSAGDKLRGIMGISGIERRTGGGGSGSAMWYSPSKAPGTSGAGGTGTSYSGGSGGRWCLGKSMLSRCS
jgi:hypothetical protein